MAAVKPRTCSARPLCRFALPCIHMVPGSLHTAVCNAFGASISEAIMRLEHYARRIRKIAAVKPRTCWFCAKSRAESR
jgi:hypothetical protein